MEARDVDSDIARVKRELVSMKKIVIVSVAAGLMGLAACTSQTPAENNAEAMEHHRQGLIRKHGTDSA